MLRTRMTTLAVILFKLSFLDGLSCDTVSALFLNTIRNIFRTLYISVEESCTKNMMVLVYNS